jgi:DNA-binding PadR family transcriptional regulator
MEREGLLSKREKNVDGRIIKLYRTTKLGEEILREAIEKASQLTHEVKEKGDDVDPV